jgi:hypothetical protein
MAVDSTTRNVADRLDALAAALLTAGVSPERSARLLAVAATAATNAVLLDALLEESHSAPPVPATEVRPAEQPARLAA